MFSAYHQERVADINAAKAPGELAGLDKWRVWALDLTTRQATLVDAIDFNSGGLATQVVDGRGFIMVPKGDYSTTVVYELLPSGVAERRWEIDGWSGTLFKLR